MGPASTARSGVLKASPVARRLTAEAGHFGGKGASEIVQALSGLQQCPFPGRPNQEAFVELGAPCLVDRAFLLDQCAQSP